MTTAIDAAKNIQSFLTQLRLQQMSSDARHALDQDLKYIDTAIHVLSTGEEDAINSLWREVQFFSRFFGGDYAIGEDGRRFTELADVFQEAFADHVVRTRAK